MISSCRTCVGEITRLTFGSYTCSYMFSWFVHAVHSDIPSQVLVLDNHARADATERSHVPPIRAQPPMYTHGSISSMLPPVACFSSKPLAAANCEGAGEGERGLFLWRLFRAAGAGAEAIGSGSCPSLRLALVCRWWEVCRCVRVASSANCTSL